jgi:UPF0755 protein
MPQDHEKVLFEVESGPFRFVIDKLHEQGFIKNKKIFSMYAHFLKIDQKIKTGEFELSKDMWATDILKVLTSGKNYQRTFTIQEGLNIFEIAELLESKEVTTKKAFLDYVRNPQVIEKLLGFQAPSLEGYLYPDTYYYTKHIHLDKLVSMMVEHFNQVINDIAPQLKDDKKLLNRMVTLASIVEKETGAPEERPTIASIFYNRLKKGMRLQSDPTIIYGLEMKSGEIVRNIHKKDILAKNPFNTYAISGLPIGPISNPGKDAINAVLKPQKTEYLYFVSMNEGRHYFSRTYEEHNAAVKKYQVDPKARAGKSWRGLSKQKN